MKKFLLALFFTAFALTGAHAQPAQQSPAQPDVKPTILDPVANKRVAEISAQLRCLVCQNQSIADSNAELAMDLKSRSSNRSQKARRISRLSTSWLTVTETSFSTIRLSR